MKPSTLLPCLLVGACCAINLAIVGEIQVRHNSWPEAGGILGIGFVIGQVPLLAFWLVWGRGSIFVRGIGTLIGICLLGCVGSYSEHRGLDWVSEWLGLLLIQLGCLLVPFSIARMSNFQLLSSNEIDASHSLPVKHANHQFTIWWLLSLTTIVGIVISVLRFVEVPITDVFDAVVLFAILTMPSCVTLLLGFWMNKFSLAAVLAIVMFPLASCSWYFMQLSGPSDKIQFVLTVCIQGAVVVCAAGILRNAGFRLRRDMVTASESSNASALESEDLGDAL